MAHFDDDLSEQRELYRLIFDWHKKFGIDLYTRRFSDPVTPDDNPYFAKYVTFLEQLPPPNDVDSNAILRLTHEVLSGCMEWSYNERVSSGARMFEIARRLASAVKNLSEQRFEEDAKRKIGELRNQSNEPQIVEIVLPDTLSASDAETYERFALIAYDDIGTATQGTALGGLVALADSNLEKEIEHRESNATTIRFRNACAMHFEIEDGENSIVKLVKQGAITIADVRIGAPS